MDLNTARGNRISIPVITMKYACIILALSAMLLSAQEASPQPLAPVSIQASDDQQLENQLKELKEQSQQGDLEATRQVYTRYALAGKTDQARAWAARHMEQLAGQADGGDAKAMMLLATNYLYGKDYTEPSLEKATAWFSRAAENGEPAAAFILGDLFDKQGDKADSKKFYEKAYQEYSKLAPGNPNALYWLGYMEQNGLGTNQNPESGISKLQQSADAGCQWAWLQLFKTYAQGIGTQKDPAKAIQYARKLADTGRDGLMAWATACAYLNGEGVEKDESLGEHYLDMAAAANIAPAIGLKGERLLKAGKDLEAYNCFSQAASMGEARAMTDAGRMSLYGAKGVEKDEARGLNLLQTACDRYDSPVAPYELGLYYDSIGEPRLADSWYIVASNRGVAEAMGRRGLLHIIPSSELEWSPTLMYRWWSAGSKAGDPDCTLYLRLFLYGFIPLVLIIAFGVPALIVHHLNKKVQKEEESHAAPAEK